MPRPMQPRPNLPQSTSHLTAWRLAAGLTLEEVADTLCVSHSTVQRWETGGIAVKAKHLEALAKLYKTKPDALMAPPEIAPMMEQVVALLLALPEDKRRVWLETGAAMVGPVRETHE